MEQKSSPGAVPFLGAAVATALRRLLTRAVTKGWGGPGERLRATPSACFAPPDGKVLFQHLQDESRILFLYCNKQNGEGSAVQKATRPREELPAPGNMKYLDY